MSKDNNNLTNNNAIYNNTGQYFSTSGLTTTYLTCGTNCSLGTSDYQTINFTVFVKQKLFDNSANRKSLCQRQDGAGYLGAYWIYNNAGDNRVYFSVSDIVSGSVNMFGDLVNTNQWYYIGATYNSSGTATIKINPLNGSAIYTRTSSVTANLRLNKSIVTCIGKDCRTGGETFNGSLDDIIIYNISLSNTEMDSILNGTSPLSLHPESLVAWYPMDNRSAYE
jgi:hypothetical protein